MKTSVEIMKRALLQAVVWLKSRQYFEEYMTMGTRADFYVGKGEQAEWLGSVAWDGHEWGSGENEITKNKTGKDYRDAVAEVLTSREDGTTPEMGWPWPWSDSGTTDYAYCFVGGNIEVFCFGRPLWDEEAGGDEPEKEIWPNMGANFSAEAGSVRSGVIVIQAT